MPPTAIGIGNRRLFSADVFQLPVITDPNVQRPFKDLMAASWDEIPDGVIYYVKEALSKTTEGKAGQEALANVFCAAEAVEHFSGVLVSLKMELDDSIGLSGEVWELHYFLFENGNHGKYFPLGLWRVYRTDLKWTRD